MSVWTILKNRLSLSIQWMTIWTMRSRKEEQRCCYWSEYMTHLQDKSFDWNNPYRSTIMYFNDQTIQHLIIILYSHYQSILSRMIQENVCCVWEMILHPSEVILMLYLLSFKSLSISNTMISYDIFKSNHLVLLISFQMISNWQSIML